MRVLFLCTGNSARSQMAEAILRHLSGGAFEVASTGTKPQTTIPPMAKNAAFDMTATGLLNRIRLWLAQPAVAHQ